ncbi:methionyl-tRNA formyltransferase [Cellulophaga baltica]|uniref:methionyl-tRNA formyltransferase n=1 Tax=Cellulophaga TaxID=104264 RepID=UPI001C078EE3|nr:MULTISPECIES: methionyl-tRNA formyltransferase [Cellulophaga]MBU2997330.1 methionyl-tRNA formyltransferase [Cellulophaga baltica]MDO6768728.1 methionyl-tRNA formyltransferase [Cellulophaga sp. 1_MG-2023]
MNKLRIVFMGTPDFAVGILDTLVKNSYEVVGVITAPDKPAGRGRKLQESAVKKYAVANNLNVLQPTNLKNEDFIEELKALQANLQIIVAFRMLPKVVWEIPEFGTFNLHASLLPDYRGAAPINWTIINGETKTGATTFFIDDKIDTGEIILQSEIDITENDTAGTLHDKLMHSGASLVLETVQLIEKGEVTTKAQPKTPIEKVAYKIHKDTCEINWDKPIETIYNHIRGLSPYPASWTTLYTNDEELFLKVYQVEIEKTTHDFKLKSVIFDKKTIKIAVEGGFVQLLEIQLPGKRKMKTQDVLNGLKLSENAHVG